MEKKMSLYNFILNYKTSDDDLYTGFDTKEEEAEDLFKNNKKQMMEEFMAFSKRFCQSLNYTLISCNGEEMIYIK